MTFPYTQWPYPRPHHHSQLRPSNPLRCLRLRSRPLVGGRACSPALCFAALCWSVRVVPRGLLFANISLKSCPYLDTGWCFVAALATPVWQRQRLSAWRRRSVSVRRRRSCVRVVGSGGCAGSLCGEVARTLLSVHSSSRSSKCVSFSLFSIVWVPLSSPIHHHCPLWGQSWGSSLGAHSG